MWRDLSVHRARAGILSGAQPDPSQALQALPRCAPFKLWRSEGWRRRTSTLRHYLRSVRENRHCSLQAFDRPAGPLRRMLWRQSRRTAANLNAAVQQEVSNLDLGADPPATAWWY